MLRENSQPLVVIVTPLRKLVILSAKLSSLVSYAGDIILLTSALLSQRCEECGLRLKNFLLLKKHIVSQQPTQPLVDQVVEPISTLVNPTLLSESDPDVIKPMSSLVNPTLPLESDFHEAVELILLLINPFFFQRVKCLLVIFSLLPVQNLLNKGALNSLRIDPHQDLRLLPLIGIS